MRRRIFICLLVTSAVVVAALAPLTASAEGLDLPWWHNGPPTLADVARRIDCIQEKLLNQGTVVVKQPDIWSQARMTMFRKEFENTMSGQLGNFNATLAARIARSDSASLRSETDIAGVLTPFGSPAQGQPTFTPQITTQGELTSALANVGTLVPSGGTGVSTTVTTPTVDFTKSATGAATFQLLNQAATGATDAAGHPIPPSGINLGLEPNIALDQRADYIGHLHRIRRVNLGDDTADSAGYGLYLMRVPISIQPGDQTKKGWGAITNMTIRHDFGPRFLPATYRNLVINDLVDQLAPVVHELIRSGFVHPDELGQSRRKRDSSGPKFSDSYNTAARHAIQRALHQPHTTNRLGPRTYAIAPSDVNRVFQPDNLLRLAGDVDDALDLHDLISSTGQATITEDKRARLTDVRAFLRQELESAYDLMEGRCKEEQALLQDVEYIDSLADQVYCRKFEGPKGANVKALPEQEKNEFSTLYESFTTRLPGNLQGRAIGVLCWGIAVEAGLLNRQLHEDMKQTKGADGYTCPPEVDEMPFFAPQPIPEVEAAFEAYVKARWPMITFSVEPVVEEQNIEDSLTRRRDLQLAVAFAFSAGRISFRQMLQYNRQLQYEAQTIALNQTVVSFANGNDTFGWRITPRFQTPPEESNPRAIANLLLRGGPGPNWTLDNMKIEPGLRELTAVVIMPSFVRGMRLDVSGDWFRLHDPDERKLHTARTIEIGRQINEARDCLEEACKCGKYRPEDVERLRVRLHQLESMLPMQTQFVKVPYENTLGGFALFTQGLTALVPELLGFEGLQYIDPQKGGDIVVYGKHFNIYETEVVVGGLTLPREGTGTAIVTNTANNNATTVVGSNLSPLRTDNGLVLVTSTGTVVANIKDMGSYNVQSREIMRVRIPTGGVVQTATRGDGTQVVELYVSTPTGISNRLQIPIDPAKTMLARSPIISSAAGYMLADPALTVVIQTKAGSTQPGVPTVAKGTTVRLVPLTSKRPNEVAVKFTIPIADNQTIGPFEITGLKPNQKTGVVTLSEAQLNDKIEEIFGLLTIAKKATGPGTTYETNPIEVILDLKGSSVKTSNKLSILFQSQTGPSASTAPASTATNTALASNAFRPPSQGAASAIATSAGAQAARKNSSTFQRVSASDRAVLQASTRGGSASTSNQSDPSVRLISADNAEPDQLPELLGQADGAGTVVRTQNGAPATPGNVTTLGLGNTVTIPNPSTVVIPGSTPAQTAQSLVVMPRSPAINVTVPVTNNTAPPRRSGGLFHRRKEPATPQNPTRPPLLERLIGGR